MADDLLSLLGGGRSGPKSSSGSYFANKYASSGASSSSFPSGSSSFSSSPFLTERHSSSGPAAGYDEATDAPLDLMNKFLACVQENRMKDAYQLCDQILQYEPTNKIILEYKKTLQEYLSQGLEEEEEEDDDDDDDEEDDNEEDEDEEDEDNDDANDESDSENESKRPYDSRK